jgi:hypothetical protein
MSRFNPKYFDQGLSRIIAEVDKKFEAGIKPYLKPKAKPEMFVEDFKIDLENRLRELYDNKNHSETTVFLKANDIRRRFGITFGQALKKYLETEGAITDLNFDILTRIIGLNQYIKIRIPVKLRRKKLTKTKKPANVKRVSVIQPALRIKEQFLYPSFTLLMPYFSSADLKYLARLLKGERLGRKLVFLSNGNKLTDYFWLLTSPDFRAIVDSKTILERWIIKSFQYQIKNAKAKNFKANDVHKSISTKSRRCKDPFLQKVDLTACLDEQSED